jgi:L-Ala-D/L-Glu epimerase
MTPVLGNGVASDVGCWMEACVARDHVPNAGELNGFLRTADTIVTNPLAVEDGAIRLPANYRPELDRDAMKRFAVDAFST